MSKFLHYPFTSLKAQFIFRFCGVKLYWKIVYRLIMRWSYTVEMTYMSEGVNTGGGGGGGGWYFSDIPNIIYK